LRRTLERLRPLLAPGGGGPTCSGGSGGALCRAIAWARSSSLFTARWNPPPLPRTHWPGTNACPPCAAC